jgi:hypothetical protein
MAKRDLDLLLYPISDDCAPLCSTCQQELTLLTFDARGDAIDHDMASFVCPDCRQSERYLIERS